MKRSLKTSPDYRGLSISADRDSLQSLVDNTTDLMWSVDRNFNVISSNQAFDNTLGKVLRKAAGEDSLVNQLHFITLYERAFSGETFTEIEYTEKPVEQWLEISYHPIREDNEITGVSCYSHDVSSAKKEVARLKLLESVVTNATDAILITEATRSDKSVPRIIYVNNALLKMTGYSREEIIGKTPNFLLGPNSDGKQVECLRRCFEDSVACEIEIVNYKKNGGEFWVHMFMAPVADNDGHFTHFIVIGRDITERIENIAAIKEQNFRLGEIARIQSHEVRGPLARIKGLINLLANYSQSMDRTSTEEVVNYLNISAKEMDEVIKQVIKFSEEIPLLNKR